MTVKGSGVDAKKVVVLATHNAGKVRELQEPLQAFGLRVLGLKDFPELAEVEETGTTFEENALLKARAVAEKTACLAVADDSGLLVDALCGAPGVYSARYSADWPLAFAGESAEQRNNRKLLAALQGVPEAARTGRFVCVMAACKPGGAEALVTRGVWEGRILAVPAGENGFGYDPLFFDPELGRSAAELSREEKMARSHRGKALRELLRRWPGFWSGAEQGGNKG